MISQHLSGMQVSTVSTQEAPYDINGGFNQGKHYGYGQPTLEQVNYMKNSSRNPNNDSYSNAFNQGWRNHPNFGWKEQLQRPQPNFNNNSQGRFNQNKFNNFNNHQFQTSQPQQASTQPQNTPDLASLVAKLFKSTHSFIKETSTSIRNLKVQVGQLSKRIPERSTNTLPGDTEVNPRKECKSLTMDNESILKKVVQVVKESEEKKEAPERAEDTLTHAPSKAPMHKSSKRRPRTSSTLSSWKSLKS
ncbi:biogenesis of lysosome-related organelles complex 1 subunit 2-like [Arachis ipaensis]|uniref:biogenesis of lysosome-related organelles complex 1 subunit 2-like n=1 Tax=Arachis ipaensis TaxID=130454 RepID=UPI0007AF7BD3|nr:biogenesis of lysosome-related organelles complex 1 subunit 2-like [Arachis ipaensis]XP_025678880.1 biogenesis of lysosome-related organelles complex 1 subunit 2-like [Arachis hypogaea]